MQPRTTPTMHLPIGRFDVPDSFEPCVDPISVEAAQRQSGARRECARDGSFDGSRLGLTCLANCFISRGGVRGGSGAHLPAAGHGGESGYSLQITSFLSQCALRAILLSRAVAAARQCLHANWCNSRGFPSGHPWSRVFSWSLDTRHAALFMAPPHTTSGQAQAANLTA